MDILKIAWNSFESISITINVFVILVLIALWLIINRAIFSSKNYEIDKAELGIGSHKVVIKANYEDRQIAYKLWVELSTRKIGLPIDLTHDLIDEIYNSWYEFFKLTRELIKTIPISKIKNNESTRILVDVAIDVLNEGLRPHLTKWHAKYRKWHKFANQNNDSASPQELQRQFPEYDSLIEDMKLVNGRLIKYRDTLKRIAFNGE